MFILWWKKKKKKKKKRFQYFDFETNFLKHKNLFQKTEYRFLVESTRTESAIFSFKIAVSETNVKTNRMGSTR